MRRSAGQQLRAYVELARPANVVTAFADILAGFAASGASAAAFSSGSAGDFAVPSVALGWPADLAWLLAATAGLYAGGVALNDVFDADVDAVERPERPIPSGRATRLGAGVYGTVLLAGGVAAAGLVSIPSLLLAAAVAGCAVLYDAIGKHYALLGPLNMGLCRGGNLLLGVSIIPAMLGELWFLALVPVGYIGAVTSVSRGEVRGGRRVTGVLAVLLVSLVVAALLLLGLRADYRIATAAPFVGLFALLVAPPFVRAAYDPTADVIRTAVRRGVLSLVVMNAALAAGFGGWMIGLAVLILLPISIGLARLFAVT